MTNEKTTAEQIRETIEARREAAEYRRQARKARQEWIARDNSNEAR